MRRTSVLIATILALLATGTAAVCAAGSFRAKIPVFATDADATPVEPHQAEDFRLTQDGRPVSVTEFLEADSPLLLILALDTTGDRTYIDAVRESLTEFTRTLPANIQIMVLTINDGVKPVQNNTADKELLAAAIADYAITGRPGFLENVATVAANANKIFMRHPLRVATLFITDSDIYNYRRRYSTGDFTTQTEGIRNSLKSVFAPIYVLRLPVMLAGPEVLRSQVADENSPITGRQYEVERDTPESQGASSTPQTPYDTNADIRARDSAHDRGNEDTLRRTYEGAIRQLARETGGEVAYPLSLSGVAPALEILLRRIQATVVVGFSPADAKVKGGERLLDVGWSGPSGDHPPVRLEYKRSFRLAD